MCPLEKLANERTRAFRACKKCDIPKEAKTLIEQSLTFSTIMIDFYGNTFIFAYAHTTNNISVSAQRIHKSKQQLAPNKVTPQNMDTDRPFNH